MPGAPAVIDPLVMLIAVLSVELAAIRPPLVRVSTLPPRSTVVAPPTTTARLLAERAPVSVMVPAVPMRTLSPEVAASRAAAS